MLRYAGMLVVAAMIVGGCARERQVAAPRVQPAAPAKPVAPAKSTDTFDWHDARTLTIEGRGWNDTATFYERLPARAKAHVTPQVWKLARHTAGIAVRFVTNSPRIAARWDGGGAMNHMAATGNSGLDLYMRTDAGWRFRAVGRPNPEPTTRVLAGDCPTEPTEYLLYLPLYQAVTDLQIGVEPGTQLMPGPPRAEVRRLPLIFYGTSITQGGCAARAGMCHPAILGRWLDREVINLGLSGSGKMEPAMAELLAEIASAAFILECLPNMTTEMVRERVGPFVRMLREKRPQTPIVLVESPFDADTNAGNLALRTIFNLLIAEGVSGLHLLPGAGQLDGVENGTVDGVHPTDLGFFRMAQAYHPRLAAILVESAPPAQRQ